MTYILLSIIGWFDWYKQKRKIKKRNKIKIKQKEFIESFNKRNMRG
jgi:nicotinamide riboside transporter PnuC